MRCQPDVDASDGNAVRQCRGCDDVIVPVIVDESQGREIPADVVGGGPGRRGRIRRVIGCGASNIAAAEINRYGFLECDGREFAEMDRGIHV